MRPILAARRLAIWRIVEVSFVVGLRLLKLSSKPSEDLVLCAWLSVFTQAAYGCRWLPTGGNRS